MAVRREEMVEKIAQLGRWHRDIQANNVVRDFESSCNDKHVIGVMADGASRASDAVHMASCLS